MTKRGTWAYLVINAVLFVALIAYLHFASYLYELGLFDRYNLPHDLIEVHYTSFINEIAPITVTIVVILIILAVFFTQYNRRAPGPLLTILGLLPSALIIFWPILIWQNSPVRWFIAIVFLLVWSALFLVAPQIGNRLKDSYKQRLYAQQIKDARDITAILRSIGWVSEGSDVDDNSHDEHKADPLKDEHPQNDLPDARNDIAKSKTNRPFSLYDSLVDLAKLYFEADKTTFDEFAEKIAEPLDAKKFTEAGRGCLNKIVYYAWDEASGKVMTKGYDELPDEIKSALNDVRKEATAFEPTYPTPFEGKTGELYDPIHYDYFKSNGKFYKIEIHFFSDAEILKGASSNKRINDAKNILIERECKTDEEKKVRVYTEFAEMIRNNAVLRQSKVVDKDGNPLVVKGSNTADELADAWGIERNPVIRYVWKEALGQRFLDYDDLPSKIRSAIPTKLITADLSSKYENKNKPGALTEQNNTIKRRIILAAFAIFVIVLLPFLAYEGGDAAAVNQIYYITFRRDEARYVVFRIYDSHEICRRLGGSDNSYSIGSDVYTYTKSDMDGIQSLRLGPITEGQ